MSERFTRREVSRILGVEERRLNYWEKLRLVQPEKRWGQRLYTFADLIALKTVRQLTENRIPARRLRRAIAALEEQLGQARVPLASLRVVSNGREVVVIPPEPHRPPVAPLTGQYLLNFQTRELASKVRALGSRTAEEWFEKGLACDSNPETLPQAVEAYSQALGLAPEWVEAHVALGTALYQLNRLEEARRVFRRALALAPHNPAAALTLGCVLFELGETDECVVELRRAVQLAPRNAEAHLNLALAYEKRGADSGARRHWSSYLRLENEGPWADYARSRLGRPRSLRRPPKTIPFRPTK